MMAERDALAAREFAALIPDGGFWETVWLAGVEYPFTSPKAMGSVGLKTILGAVMTTIPPHVHCVPLPARVWQPWFLRERLSDDLPKLPRKSADRKPLIAAHALAMLDVDGWPQDALDAFGISVAVERMNDAALSTSTDQHVMGRMSR